MHTPSMKSQPSYPPMEWDRSGQQHILFAAGEDPALARRLFEWPPLGTLTVLSIQDDAHAPSCWRQGLPPGAQQRVARDRDSALQQLHDGLEQACMSARLYAVGDEDTIWQALRVAERAGMGSEALRRHRVATQARPVYCVHCRHTTPGVTTNVADCVVCGRALFVRDHFSRRLGAYMGFQVDAEVPGERPGIEEIYR